jgi:hypothetical protein
LSDGEKCTLWEALGKDGKCQRCEQKETQDEKAAATAAKNLADTPVKVTLKDAKQSSTWPSKHRGWWLEAKNAIDDNQDSFAHTRMGRGHWWRANFEGGSTTVKYVKITNRRDCCGDRLRNSKVYIGRTLCATVPGYTYTKQVLTLDCKQAIKGDQIIIRGNSSYTALQLATVEVYGLDNCLIDESKTGHKCQRNGPIQCAGARTCSRWGWCQGQSQCPPRATPAPAKKLPYTVIVR